MNRRLVSVGGSGDGGEGGLGGGAGAGAADEVGGEKSFSVMQWNILAQTLAQHGNFKFATEEVLDWQHRRDLIIKVETFLK